MTPREQVALFLFTVLPMAIAILWGADWVMEQVDDYRAREKVWREIEVRCSRERHPSFQAKLYNWEEES